MRYNNNESSIVSIAFSVVQFIFLFSLGMGLYGFGLETLIQDSVFNAIVFTIVVLFCLSMMIWTYIKYPNYR